MLHQRVIPRPEAGWVRRFCFSWIAATLSLGVFVGFVVVNREASVSDGLELLGYYAASFPLVYLAGYLIVRTVRGPHPESETGSDDPNPSGVPVDG